MREGKGGALFGLAFFSQPKKAGAGDRPEGARPKRKNPLGNGFLCLISKVHLEFKNGLYFSGGCNQIQCGSCYKPADLSFVVGVVCNDGVLAAVVMNEDECEWFVWGKID